MRPFLTLAFIGLCFSLTAQETINYPYNPDGNADGNITVPDLTDFLVNYGNAFAPTEIQIDGVGLAEVISTLQATVEAQQTYITQLQQYISVTEETVLISGANLQVVSGSGETAEATNGTGNIIIGYDEDSGNEKSGSHNLVVGFGHTYSSYGGIVVGYNNRITGQYASVSGGAGNTASEYFSSVSGGGGNTASGNTSSVSGGYDNTASGTDCSVSGGNSNTASGGASSVSGGRSNTAEGVLSSVSGGSDNNALGYLSYVSGGYSNSASGYLSSVSGGNSNNASGEASSVLGGHTNIAFGSFSSVSGGFENTASGNYSSVSGDNSYQDWVVTQGFLTEETDPVASAAGYSTGGVDGLENYLSVDESTNTVLISGANLQVVSGSGGTAAAVNGTGNIIIGYDENNNSDKSGSHNLVVGRNHTYSSYGGIVAGLNNSITGQASSVLGGEFNTASGQRSSVSGGIFNIALGDNSFVSGGFDNIASGTYSSVLGGELNIASGPKSSISGGYDNNALGTYSVVLGSAGNTFLDNAPYGILIE